MNNHKDQTPNYKIGALGYTGVLALMIWGSVMMFRKAQADWGTYVVKDKGANKIEYYSIKNPADTHIMTFDADTVFAKGGWYPYINVGDTIQGHRQFMNKPVNSSWYYGSIRFPTPLTAIHKLNGKYLNEVREITRRDSLMREMKQR